MSPQSTASNRQSLWERLGLVRFAVVALSDKSVQPSEDIDFGPAS